jgi:hypothetical protein
MTRRLDGALVAAALGVAALLCLVFRYLPVIDLPQHYAMVSIIAHHGDPAYGFGDRYVFDFLGRPYATVYLLAAAMARIMPLAAAMRLTVALCTVAPLAGLAVLLRALGRRPVHALLAAPTLFGSLWHWGFLNFLLGTGLMLLTLALSVDLARAPGRGRRLGVGALAVLLFFTHVHGLLMLLGLAPLFVWAFREEQARARVVLARLLPLAPAAVLCVAFVALTWARAPGPWAAMNPGLRERLALFADHLGAGLPPPWPAASLGAMVLLFVALALMPRTPGAGPGGRRLAALGLALASQVGFCLLLPLNTGTATYLSARHALLIVLFAVPLLPEPAGAWRQVARGGLVALAAGTLTVAGWHLARFDREARDFDAIIPHMERNRRVAPLVFLPRSRLVHPRVFPYLHFAAYSQAAKGGDLARSFAQVWNVPIRYRPGFARYVLDERVEFNPWLFSFTRDLPHFDYLLIRRNGPSVMPAGLGLRLRAQRGAWSLWENPRAVTP